MFLADFNPSMVCWHDPTDDNGWYGHGIAALQAQLLAAGARWRMRPPCDRAGMGAAHPSRIRGLQGEDRRRRQGGWRSSALADAIAAKTPGNRGIRVRQLTVYAASRTGACRDKPVRFAGPRKGGR